MKRLLKSAATLIPLVLLLPALGLGQQLAPPNTSVSASSQKTLFFNCLEKEWPKSVFSPVSLSERGEWRAYVEVQGDSQCLLTTRLWVAKDNDPYRLVYLMPPRPTEGGNGMEILGWAPHSGMLLVRTEQWQWGSDAVDIQQVLAIEASTGVVYEADLEAMLETRKDKQCLMRVTDAGFNGDNDFDILIRAKFSTYHEGEETEADVPAAKRCENAEETWRFMPGGNKQVANTEPLHLFKDFLPNLLQK